MKYDEEELRLENLIGKDRASGEKLFEIRVARGEHVNANGGDTRMTDPSESETTYVVTYEFSEEEEKREYKWPSGAKGDSPWADERMTKWILHDAMAAALDYSHTALFRFACKEEQNDKMLFEVTVGTAPAASR